jgi:hypothetical protein
MKALTLMVLACAGCALRTAAADYYVGPLLHRTVARCGETQVSQVVHVGALAEVGRQTGISIGLVDRIAVTPAPPDDAACDPSEPEALVAVPPDPAPGAWSFSPLYLRVPRRGEPRLVRRALTGAQLAAGPESTALSLGAVFTTLMHPPDDAFAAVRFDASRPMESRFTVWTVSEDAPIPETTILEEFQR